MCNTKYSESFCLQSLSGDTVVNLEVQVFYFANALRD